MIRFRVFPARSGEGFSIDVDPTSDLEASLEGPFPTSGAARRAVRVLQGALRSATIVVLDAPPEDSEG